MTTPAGTPTLTDPPPAACRQWLGFAALLIYRWGYTMRAIPRNDLLTSVAELGVVAVASCARSVVDGQYRGSDRLEPRDQLVELVRAEHVVRRRRQLVGEGLDPLPGLPADVGEPTDGVHEAAASQPVDDSGQLCLG